jgi:hypothetical protein
MTAPPLSRRIALSAFILFHWACVLAWVWPNPSALKTAFFSIRLPAPSGHSGPGLPIVSAYLFHTGQHQDWAMFAPNPLQINRYVAATVTLRDGRKVPYSFPRLSQIGYFEGWIEKRYRKLQHRIAEEPVRAYREDLARFIARRVGDPANPPVRVELFDYQSPIPRHDRPRTAEWIDYTSLLRDQARFTPVPLLDYRVRPEDLP